MIPHALVLQVLITCHNKFSKHTFCSVLLDLPLKMQALRYHYNDTSRDFTLDDIPKPEVKHPDDVLVKVQYSGLCGTDLHIISVSFKSHRNQSHCIEFRKSRVS